MNAWSVDYSVDSDHPALVEMCMNCRYTDCPGICTDYKNKLREIHNIRRIKRRPKAERVADESKYYEAFGERHSIWEWSQMYGMRYKTLYERIRRSGMTMEEALTRPLQKASIPTIYTVNGMSKSIKEWSQTTGLSQNTIYSRLARSWPFDEAVGLTPHVQGGKA